MIDVRLHALGLPVGTVRPADFDPFVPNQAHPTQIVQNGLLRLACRAFEIGILDAEYERALVPAREQPIKQGGSGVPDVQMTGGRRGETNSHQWHLILPAWYASPDLEGQVHETSNSCRYWRIGTDGRCVRTGPGG